MATLESNLKIILGNAVGFAKDDLKKLIADAKSDGSQFIKKQAKSLEKYIEELAKGEISKEEFEDLVKGLTSLDTMEFHRLSAEVKARAQELANQMTELVIDGLLKMV